MEKTNLALWRSLKRFDLQEAARYLGTHGKMLSAMQAGKKPVPRMTQMLVDAEIQLLQAKKPAPQPLPPTQPGPSPSQPNTVELSPKILAALEQRAEKRKVPVRKIVETYLRMGVELSRRRGHNPPALPAPEDKEKATA